MAEIIEVEIVKPGQPFASCREVDGEHRLFSIAKPSFFVPSGDIVKKRSFKVGDRYNGYIYTLYDSVVEGSCGLFRIDRKIMR